MNNTLAPPWSDAPSYSMIGLQPISDEKQSENIYLNTITNYSIDFIPVI